MSLVLFIFFFFWEEGGGKVGSGGDKAKENYWNLLHTYTTQTNKKGFAKVNIYMPDVYKARLYYYLLWIMFTLYNSYMRFFSFPSSCPLSCVRACLRACPRYVLC